VLDVKAIEPKKTIASKKPIDFLETPCFSGLFCAFWLNRCSVQCGFQEMCHFRPATHLATFSSILWPHFNNEKE